MKTPSKGRGRENRGPNFLRLQALPSDSSSIRLSAGNGRAPHRAPGVFCCHFDRYLAAPIQTCLYPPPSCVHGGIRCNRAAPIPTLPSLILTSSLLPFLAAPLPSS